MKCSGGTQWARNRKSLTVALVPHLLHLHKPVAECKEVALAAEELALTNYEKKKKNFDWCNTYLYLVGMLFCKACE